MRIPRKLAPVLAAGCVLSLSATALASPQAVTQQQPKRHKATSRGTNVKIKGGTITFTLLPSVASSFASDNPKIVFAPVAPATGSDTAVSMPITSGKLNNATGVGSVVAGGGAPSGNGFTLTQTTPGLNFGFIELGGITQQFSLSAPVTVTLGGKPKFGPGTGSNLSANVNGSTSPPGPFFTLKAGKPKVKGKGRTLAIANIPAFLTSQAAQSLSSFIGVKFTAGEQLGKVTIQAGK
jgi:hypothetical protein